MDLLLAFNIAVALVTFLSGWLMKSLFDRITKLEDADAKILGEIAKLREELPTNYVRRGDMQQSLNELFSAIRRIEDKLDSKADRAAHGNHSGG